MNPSIVVEKAENHKPDPETEINALSGEMHDIAANSIVKSHVIASMTLGLVPIPLFDLTALTITQMEMIHALGRHYGVTFQKHASKSLITSLVAGSLPVIGVVGLSSFAKLIPGIGSLLGSATLGVSAGAVSYALGHTFMMHFEAGGTLEDFEPGDARAFFQREFEKGKLAVKDIQATIKGAEDEDDPTAAEHAGAEPVAAEKKPG